MQSESDTVLETTKASPEPSIHDSNKHKLAALILLLSLFLVEILLSARFPAVRYFVWSPMPPHLDWSDPFRAAISYWAQRWLIEKLVFWVMPLPPTFAKDVEAGEYKSSIVSEQEASSGDSRS
jgi:hypothetical protein